MSRSEATKSAAGATPLAQVLLRPVPDNAHTRRYQAALDRLIDALKAEWDIERGLLGSAGVALPHEQHRDYWNMEPAGQRRLTSQDAEAVYKRNAGRDGTAPLCRAAFCWRSPLSRHHRDPDLLRYFRSGLKFFADSIRDDGFMGTYGLNGEHWAHGWDVEGLIYGLILCREALDQGLVDHVRRKFQQSAGRHASIPDVPGQMGSYGNQRAVFTLGLHLYGQLLDRPELIAQSDLHFNESMPKILDASGQVIEQQGPCMHYSFTAFIYAWLNLVVRGDARQHERVLNCLRWFRARFTDSYHPIAGPSARKYYETLAASIGDLLPAAEQLAALDPMPREWALGAVERLNAGAKEREDGAMPIGDGHGASVLMWAMLMNAGAGAPSAEARRRWAGPALLDCGSTHLLKRAALKYLLVRRGYQTHFNYTDYLPFSGVQTWAWGNEPPIIHPTPLAPSTTQGDRLDTARQGVSHNWGGYGAGAVGVDGYLHAEGEANDLPLLVARYDWLWRVVIFTPVSTVVLEFGAGGPRRTLWTLNRVEPARPEIETGLVTFAGRTGCLHSTLPQPPTLVRLDMADEWARGVRQLRFECGDGPAAFGLSNGTLHFETAALERREMRFGDDSGHYVLTLDERFFKSNPGNFRVDTYQLAHGSAVRRRA